MRQRCNWMVIGFPIVIHLPVKRMDHRQGCDSVHATRAGWKIESISMLTAAQTLPT